MEKVEYRDIKGYEGLYQIGSDGSILKIGRCKKPRLLKTRNIAHHGYLRIPLTVNGKTKCFRIHRLVANAFIPNPLNKPQINHKNGIKTDNRVENLEWVTNEENYKHAINNGLSKSKPIALLKNGVEIARYESIAQARRDTKNMYGNPYYYGTYKQKSKLYLNKYQWVVL